MKDVMETEGRSETQNKDRYKNKNMGNEEKEEVDIKIKKSNKKLIKQTLNLHILCLHVAYI